jgi:hypothetical protein
MDVELGHTLSKETLIVRKIKTRLYEEQKNQGCKPGERKTYKSTAWLPCHILGTFV